MKLSYLPHQQREALAFINENTGPIYYRYGLLYTLFERENGYRALLDHVSKRTLKELVRYKLISVSRNKDGVDTWDDAVVTPRGESR